MEAQAKAGCGANSIEHSYLEEPDTVRSAVDWLSTAPMENQSCIISGSTIRAPNFLAGGGEMAALMRATDGARTPIGPIESWSPTLRMMVSFLLANRFPPL